MVRPPAGTPASTRLAAHTRTRRIGLSSLKKALKNDLDWVVLNAVEKERNRRYDTASALSADLQRFLDHEPVVAGPPSAGYRLKKLVRRYRGQVLAGSAVLCTAIVGAIVAVDASRHGARRPPGAVLPCWGREERARAPGSAPCCPMQCIYLLDERRRLTRGCRTTTLTPGP